MSPKQQARLDQRQAYREKDARNANEAETLAELQTVDKDYTDTTTYMDTESDKLVQEDLRQGDTDNDPRRYEKLRQNAAGKRRAARAETGKQQQRLQGQAQFVDNLADEAAEAQKFSDFGLSPRGNNAIYAAAKEEPELVGEDRGRKIYRYPNQDDYETNKVALTPVNLRTNSQRQAEKQENRAIGRAAAQGDQQRPINEEAVRRNQVEAAVEADIIRRGSKGQRARQGERNLAQIEQIKKLGGTGVKLAYEDAVVGPPESAIQRETAVRMMNPAGDTVGYADPQMQGFLGDVDLSDSALQGELTKGQSWVAANQPDYTTYGDHQPKVKVMDQMRLFTDRLNGLGYGTAVNTEMRSVAEFETALNFVAAKAKEKGDSIFRQGEDGINRPVEIPEVSDILTNKMRYTPMETQQLAYALFQLETAKQNGVNETFKHNFEARLGNPVDKQIRFNSEGDIELARFKNEKVGRGSGKGDRVEIKGALKNLQGEDAQKPYYAAVAGEPAPRARFLRPEAYGMPNDEIMERYPKYGEDMIGVRDRFQRDVLLGEVGPQNDSYAQAQHALDREFEARGPQIQAQKEQAEKFELARLLSEGRTVNYRTGTAPARPVETYAFDTSTGPINYDDPVGAKNIDIGQGGESWETKRFAVPPNSEFNQNPKFKSIQTKQPIQEAPTPSIAPTPGDITGNQPAPMNDAGRGGWMGGDNKGRVVSNPFQEERAARSLTPELRKELSALPNRTGDTGRSIMQAGPQVTDKSDYYMDLPDGPETSPSFRRKRSAVGAHQNTRKLGGRIGYGAAVAGALGLGTLIGRERNARNEEEQYS